MWSWTVVSIIWTQGYAFSGRAIQQPGLAKQLKEQSDRHWEEGTNDIKKYSERGGQSYSRSEPSSTPSGEDNFVKRFKFEGQVSDGPMHGPLEEIISNHFTSAYSVKK